MVAGDDDHEALAEGKRFLLCFARSLTRSLADLTNRQIKPRLTNLPAKL